MFTQFLEDPASYLKILGQTQKAAAAAFTE
jgi:hypothetical protein